MIQRKQTLFLIELIFLASALLFVPTNIILTPADAFNVYLLPSTGNFISTSWHLLAIGLNAACLALAVVSVFLFKKRLLQIKLCYVQLVLWLGLAGILGAMPLVVMNGDITEIQNNYVGFAISLCAVIAAFLAARFIKKDIDLLKSADRIR